MPNKIQLNLRNIEKEPSRIFMLGEFSGLLWKDSQKLCMDPAGVAEISTHLTALYGAPLGPNSSWEDVNDVLRYIGIPYRLEENDDPSHDIVLTAIVDEGKKATPMDLSAFNDLPVEAYVTKFHDVMSKIFIGTTSAMVQYSKLMEPVMKCIEFLLSKNPKWDREQIEQDNDAFNEFMLEHGFPYRINQVNDSYTFTVKHNDANTMFHLGKLVSCLGDAASRKVVMTDEEFDLGCRTLWRCLSWICLVRWAVLPMLCAPTWKTLTTWSYINSIILLSALLMRRAYNGHFESIRILHFPQGAER